MKMKLAILDWDGNYLEKLGAALVNRYSEKIALRTFTAKEDALKILEEDQVNLLLVNRGIEVAPEEIPETCLYAYLSDTPAEDSVHPTICKFQRIDLLYGQIRQVLKERRKITQGTKVIHRRGRTILFLGAGGGMGTSSAAAACAMSIARKRKAAYLNLEQLGGADLYFSGQGNGDVADLIRAMRDPAVNLREQMENIIKKDSSGVHFVSRTKHIMNMQELDVGSMLRLISELQFTGSYDDIVLDMDFSLDRAMLAIYAMADDIVLVGDGSRSSEDKAERALDALTFMYRGKPMTKRIYRLYNRVDQAQELEWNREHVPVLGAIGAYTCAGGRKDNKEREIVEMLAAEALFDKLL